MSKASVVLVEGVPVPAKLAAAFRDRRDPSKTPFSYTAPLPPSIAVPLSKTPLCIPRVLPIVPQELIDAVREPEPPTMTHMQYNSPMPLYSRESAEEQYRQQIGNGSVPNIGSSDKHFDPEKSATLRAIQEQDREDEFGKNFFEKVAAAEAPKVPRDIEPSWASQARERSERARSRTPAAPPAHYQGGHDAIPMPPPSNQAPHSQHHSQAIPLGPPQSQQQYTNYQYDASPQQRSYAQSYKTGSPQKDKVVPEKGYQFGGMDFTGNAPVQDDGYGYYYTARPKTPVREERPGYKMGGMDFAENVRYSGYNPSYHGHGPDEPRLKSTFSADPHAPVNTYVAPNVEGVNPIRLVGDTISNQKIRHENYPSQDMKSNMGTSFAPPGGHRPDHRTVVPQPKPQEPLCYSLSAKKGAGGYYGGHVRAQSAAPGLEREKWTAEKEVNVDTLLTDEALRPIRRSMTPDWATRSHQKHDSWRHTLDPRLNRPQVFQTEPNWSRTVNERRQAWEHQAANTDARVSLPASAKVPAQQPPYWANKANSTHRIWQTAAERNLLQGQQQYGGDYGGEAQYGGQYGGGYSTQQDTYGYGSQQQQHQQQQQQYDYSQQGYQQQQQQQQQYQYQQQHQQNGYPSEQQRTTYSYSSQQAPVQSTPLQMDQSSFTKNKVTSLETTTTGPQSQAIALPAPTSGGQYQQYSSSEQRYDRRSQEQHEERVSRPVSHYEEQKDYQRSYRKETSEQRTVQPAPVSQSQVQSVTVNNDAFDRRTEMSETLPRGSLSNTQANAAGEYVDDHGRNVLYKRELTTSADPGREIQLLKEEERRVTEQPLEPGVISRHVTTKYYKKKTVTDTQQTVTQ